MLAYLRLWRWRLNVRQGDHVLVQINKTERKELKIVLPPGDGEVTVFHPGHGHEPYKINKIYPLTKI